MDKTNIISFIGLNMWTISGLFLILFGTYCVHRGSKKTLTTTINSAEENINENTNTVVNRSNQETNNPLKDLDNFMINVYKPDFDEYIATLNKHKLFLNAMDLYNEGEIKGANKDAKTSEIVKKGIEREINKTNNMVVNSRYKVEANIRTVDLINFRIQNSDILKFWNEHKSFYEDARNYYNGHDGKLQSFENSSIATKEAELRLISLIFISGIAKKKDREVQ